MSKKVRAQGNRLSFHNIQKVKAMTEEIDLSVVIEQENEIQQGDAKEQPEQKAENSSSISFEITNPDDIQMNDDGQMGLF
jgi:topoisomerase-4 subunit A